MLGPVEFLTTWILPPLVGGLIGWFTNWLAIKMLFRPHEKKYLLGLPLPFTPGILPRGRARLSQSVGEVVAAELFTPAVLSARLSSPEVARALERSLDEWLGELGGLDAGELLGAASGQASAGPLGELLSRTWRGLVGSPAFAEALEAALAESLPALESLPLSLVLPPEAARDFAAGALAPANLERIRASLLGALDALFEGRALAGSGGEGSLSALFPAELLDPLVRAAAEALYRAAAPGLVALLDRPEIRGRMEEEARLLLRGAVERLGLIQRLFVGVAGYERRLSETMPDTVEDLVLSISRILGDPAMPGRAAESVSGAFAEMARKPLSRALSGLLSREAAGAAAGAFVDALGGSGPELAARAAALAARGGEARLGGLLRALGLSSGELAARASRSVAAFLASAEGGASPRMGGALRVFGESLAGGLGGTSLGELAGLDEERRRELAAWLGARSLELVSAEAGRILEGVDIKGMVMERLDELAMPELERIILGIVDRELFWITVLGGILGALIGLIQSGLSLLFR